MATHPRETTSPSAPSGRQAPPSSLAQARLAEVYPFALPDELFAVWEFARTINAERPLEAFAACGLRICGPFARLADDDDDHDHDDDYADDDYADDDGAGSPRLAGRPTDPPEFLPLATGDNAEGLRIGYYFDDPGRRPPLVCRALAGARGLAVDGASLLDTLRAEIERRLIGLADPKARARLRRLRSELIAFTDDDRDEEGDAFLAAHVRRKRPPRRPLTTTADGVGLLAPKRLYRPLELSAEELAQRATAADPRALLELGQQALRDGFPATALLLGKELWAQGARVPHASYAIELLTASYRLLKRPHLATLAEALASARDAQAASSPSVDDHDVSPDLTAAPRRHPLWRIRALRRHQPAAIHLRAMTRAELEALTAAPWPSLVRLTFSWSTADISDDGDGDLSRWLPILSGEAVPALRHLTLLPGDYPPGLLSAVAGSPLLGEQLDTLDFHPESLPADEFEPLLERWSGGSELQLFPNAIALRDTIASYNLGVIARDLGYYHRALDLFERSIALGGDHWDYCEKGNALATLGDYGAAIDSFMMAIHHQDSHLPAWLHLADALRESGDHEGGLIALDNALDIAPDEKDKLDVLRVRARLVLASADHAAAIELAAEIEERSLQLLRAEPDDLGVHYFQAIAKRLVDDLDGALADLRLAIAHEPQLHLDALAEELFADLHEALAEIDPDTP